MSRELKIRSNLHPQNFASFSFSKCQLLSSYLNAYVITFIFSAKNCTYCKYKSGKLFSKSCVKPFWFICIECDCYIILLPMSRQGLVSHVVSLKFDTIVWSVTENMKQLWTWCCFHGIEEIFFQIVPMDVKKNIFFKCYPIM